jgi:NAD(P)H-hydrate epimerase
MLETVRSSSNLMDPQYNPAHFIAETGIDVPAITAEQMREVDRIATAETGPSLLQMMENAGRSLASLALELLGPHWRTSRVVVLAGSGGNGGGGICAGRHLLNRGVEVTACLANPRELSDVTRFQRRIFEVAAGKEVRLADLGDTQADLIIDALIGYGLKAAPRGTTTELIAWADARDIPILALDLPSGIDAATGQTPGAFIRPKWTLTLALPKLGLSPQNSGEIFLADLGIPPAVLRQVAPDYTPPYGKSFVVALKPRSEPLSK